MVEEDGKYYPMMKLVHGEEAPYSQEELYYGNYSEICGYYVSQYQCAS